MKTKIFLYIVLSALANSVVAQANTFPATGNVGVGTSSPTRKLEVVGRTRLSFLEVRSAGDSLIDIAPLLGSNDRESTLRLAATFDNYPNDTNPRFVANIHAGFNGGVWGTEYMTFGVAGAGDAGNPPIERMRINAAGNVGIGTNTPDHKLEVNGTIRAKEVVVETGWSDFVFEDGYKLRSLHDVETHIEKHGHLPDVPSAVTVASKGLSLGETQKIMMQKIEELTLYMIEKDKEVAELREKLKFQQKEIDVLKLD